MSHLHDDDEGDEAPPQLPPLFIAGSPKDASGKASGEGALYLTPPLFLLEGRSMCDVSQTAGDGGGGYIVPQRAMTWSHTHAIMCRVKVLPRPVQGFVGAATYSRAGGREKFSHPSASLYHPNVFSSVIGNP